VPPERLAAALAGLAACDAIGASVTVPHKAAAVALCDDVDPRARRIGAVNCVVFADGHTIGHNTDADGFLDGLRGAGHEPSGKRAIVLGGGGAARAVALGLADAGAEVSVVARHPERVTWTTARPWDAATLGELAPRCDLWVDATSIALGDGVAPAEVPLERSPGALVCSLMYHGEPPLLARARRLGLPTVDGAAMLVHQGARAFALWTGREAPLAAMWRALI
jgi:shikimate dehydrogenase